MSSCSLPICKWGFSLKKNNQLYQYDDLLEKCFSHLFGSCYFKDMRVQSFLRVSSGLVFCMSPLLDFRFIFVFSNTSEILEVDNFLLSVFQVLLLSSISHFPSES